MGIAEPSAAGKHGRKQLNEARDRNRRTGIQDVRQTGAYAHRHPVTYAVEGGWEAVAHGVGAVRPVTVLGTGPCTISCHIPPSSPTTSPCGESE